MKKQFYEMSIEELKEERARCKSEANTLRKEHSRFLIHMFQKRVMKITEEIERRCMV